MESFIKVCAWADDFCVPGPTTETPETTEEPTTDNPLNVYCPVVDHPLYPIFFPHSSDDCWKFYQCVEGKVVEMSCPSDQWWNTVGNYCDETENECLAITTENPLDVYCPAADHPLYPVFFPHLDCTRFYQCIDGSAIEMSCPIGQWWNVNYCDENENVECNVSTEEPPTTTEEPTPPNPQDKWCPSSDHPDYPIYVRHLSSCSKYYVCAGGKVIEQRCPEGQWYNSQQNMCEMKHYVTCLVSLPHLTDCSLFYRCIGGEAVLAMCGTGHWWDEERDECYKEEYVECNISTTEGPNPTPERTCD